MIQAAAGFFAYVVVLKDFGFLHRCYRVHTMLLKENPQHALFLTMKHCFLTITKMQDGLSLVNSLAEDTLMRMALVKSLETVVIHSQLDLAFRIVTVRNCLDILAVSGLRIATG